MVADITALKKRKIVQKVQEDLPDSQPIGNEERGNNNIEDKKTTDPVLQAGISSTTTFNELSLRIKKLFALYQEVHRDLTEIQDDPSARRLYQKYRESNVIADLTNFAKSLDNIEPVTDIALPRKEEINNLIGQVQRLFLQEKEKEDAEFAELEEDFNQRLKIYNELTSDLAKVQKEQLTLAELHNKYSDSKAILALKIFGDQERDTTPSKASIQGKITSLQELLLKFDNDLESTDF